MLEAAVGLVVPFLAAIWPVVDGTRITVREAITSYGLSKGQFGTGVIDRLLVAAEHALPLLPRPFAISLRNTFRRKGRLVLTLTTLILACALFMAVLSVRASLFSTVDDFLAYFAYDAQIVLDRPYRSVQLREEAARVPGITRLENLNVANSYRIRPDDTESWRIQIIAVEPGTVMFKPTLLEGRWLSPGDENAIVLNTEVIRNEPDIKVGDEINLRIQTRETTWQVVGIFQSISLIGNAAHVNDSYFTRLMGLPDQAGAIAIQTEQHEEAAQNKLTSALDEHFKDVGIGITYVQTSSSMQNQIRSLFDVITTLLSSMAILVGAVGGLGLMGTMSINVLERTREIGVMRAIGATDGTVQQVVLTEGILIGVLSWLVGFALAAPLGKLLSDAIGMGFLGGPLIYTFSLQGALICLVGVILLAAAASYLPAQKAASLTVREILAYE
jgi:putative ABC transport system permease protein